MTAAQPAAGETGGRGGSLPARRRTYDLRAVLRDWQPPFHRREFWAVQLLVIVIAGGHIVLELAPGEMHAALSFIPTSLFLIPVVYAALNFGLHGSLPTALWSAALTVPNAVLLHRDDGPLGEAWQVGLVIAVAVFVGQRVDHEKAARRQAEEREQARRLSEEKYRGIFDHVVEPILVLDESGAVEHANEAAGRFFGVAEPELIGRRVSDLIELDLDQPPAGQRRTVHRIATALPDRPRWVEPVLIPLGEGGVKRQQLMLRDLTPEYERQQELEAYARRTNSAREEERARIARDIHDGPVQTLVLLWRKLDALEPLPDAAAAAAMREAQAAARSAADDLRRVSRNLRPSILNDLGLLSALRAETTAFGQRSGVAARLVAVGAERRLPPECELALLRIAQEALRNVEQHAHATSTVLRLHYTADGVRLTITDDGIGLTDRPPGDLAAAGKLGLIGMREQARLVDGEVSIRTRRGGGTVITAAVSSLRPAQ